MAEFILLSHSMNGNELGKRCGISDSEIQGVDLKLDPTLLPYRPYLIGSSASAGDKSIVQSLGPYSCMRNLYDLSCAIGQDRLIALAEVRDKLDKSKLREIDHQENAKLGDYARSGIEKAASATALRGENFTTSVKLYQQSLLAYRDALKSNTSSSEITAAKLRAKLAFNKMQSGFSKEIKMVAGRVSSRKGVPLTNLKRGMNIAKSSKDVSKLELVDHIEASKVGKLVKSTKFIGDGVAILEFGEGVHKIQESYKHGKNWEKTMFVESASFASSAALGEAALTLLMAATPVGWVGLVVMGVGLAVTAAATVKTGEYMHKNAGSWYDRLMKLI